VKKIKSILKNIRSVYAGFKILKQSNTTPEFAYEAMRNLFVETKGRSNDIISLLIKKKKYPGINGNGVLKILSEHELTSVVNNIAKNGFHIFDAKLPESTINVIIDYVKNTPSTYRLIADGVANGFSGEVLFDENSPQSPVYQFSQQKIAGNAELLKLIFDQSLLEVAQEYLDAQPILDLFTMWWSVPFEGKGKSEAAQMYHFDLDRIKFIKFFFYLTDVDAATGPHCYVKGSHRKLQAALQKDGRLSDTEVEAVFGKENMLELCGKKGTIMAVDTRGLHKGKDLTRDKRLIFQIEFANSMFGQNYPKTILNNLTKEQEHLYHRFSNTYQVIFTT
jgi:hypothetical protein